ncbi:uncharacterized protein LOC122015114 isoform X2 [Zingiber officinale]|uniref:uncharacterized protein LOC122015114 isoform X2 n=1 Tax=Zingiber officinale TaxID=94328 RepID=UPI001C4BCCAE|nr:uncharacterized protein LOC122015114 isoform X2 [Zingiber officinale]
MNARTGVGSVSQILKQSPPNSGDDNVRLPEVSISGAPRPVLNYSIQTGEEFALEFMRERAISKKLIAQNAPGDQNITTTYMNIKNMPNIPQTQSESASDALVFTNVNNRDLKEIEKNNSVDTEHRGHYASSRSMLHVSSGEGSNRTISLGHTPRASDISSKRMKFLCSYGGKILPRPSDGKLRYVGGDTRIVRIRRDTLWEELVLKTTAIYSRPHMIKYQLPGEDLDALISVSSDEDLLIMIDEYSLIECSQGSQKIRLFLFAIDDTDNGCFHLENMEGYSEIQFVAAVNGMDFDSGKSSYGHGLSNTSLSDLNQLLNLNVESEIANAYTGITQSAGFVIVPVASPTTYPSSLQQSSSADYDSHSHRLEDHRYHYVDSHSRRFEDHRYHYVEGEHYSYNLINSSDICQNSNSRTSIPLHVPSDFQYTSNYTDIGISIQPDQQPFNQGASQDPYSGISLLDQETAKRDQNLAADSFSYKKMEDEHISSHIHEPSSTMQQHDVSFLSHIHAVSMHVVSEKENLTLAVTNIGKQLDATPVSSVNSVNAGHNSDLTEDDHYCCGGLAPSNIDDEADAFDVGFNNPPSQPFRGYQSASLPREQLEFLNRLSKSGNSPGSQYLINQACLLAAQESIVEGDDNIIEGEMVSHSEKSLLSAKPPCQSNETIKDDFMQFEKNKQLVNTPSEANKLESVSIPHGSETVKISQDIHNSTNQAIHDQHEIVFNPVLHVGPVQHDGIADEKCYKQGRMIQKPDFQIASSKSVSDNPSVHEERILQESNMSKHTDKPISIVDIKDAHADGSSIKPVEGPVLPDNPWAETSNDITYSTDVGDHVASLAYVDRIAGGHSLEESSGPPERKDILIDINDQFPPNLLSDIFSKAKEDLSNINPPHKYDVGLTLNMQNHDPKHWSFFRILAQGEFNHKDYSLMDQDHISYQPQIAPLDNDKVDFGQTNAQIDFSEKMQESSSAMVDNMLHKGEGLQQLRYEGGEAAEPDLDVSAYDLDLINVQIIKNEDLEELRELGSGTYGTVYHGKWRGTDVAIKRIKKSCFTGRSPEQERFTKEFWREAEILSQLHHPNVVAFYGVVKDGPGGTMATVAEFMVNGSLRHVLLRKDKYLDRRKRLIIATDTAFGMEYLHSKNIVHFDLKCDNLLVNLKDQSRPICKVGDFGLSKIKRNTLVSGGVRGTLPWMAPELLNGSSNKVSEKVDVFSFGIVMWEILTGEEPYANMHYGAIIGGIVNNTLRPPVPATCDLEWRRLMEQCWAPDPMHRPSFTQIAGHLRAMTAQAKPAK